MDFLAAGAGKFHSHAHEPKFLLLEVGGESILAQNDDRNVLITASLCKFWKAITDCRDQFGFSSCQLSRVIVTAVATSTLLVTIALPRSMRQSDGTVEIVYSRVQPDGVKSSLSRSV